MALWRIVNSSGTTRFDCLGSVQIVLLAVLPSFPQRRYPARVFEAEVGDAMGARAERVPISGVASTTRIVALGQLSCVTTLTYHLLVTFYRFE